MTFRSEFIEISLDSLHQEAAVMKADGWRFIQTHAVKGETGIDLYYSFMKDGLTRNLKVVGVTKDQPVPSITDLFLAAFVFENEARELFGVDMRDIAIDFKGAMYAPAETEPMTFITPEQKAAREKAAKAAAEKASGGDTPSEGAGSKQTPRRIFVMTPERRARLDAKLATMSPEKVAKVEAALKAREAEAKAASANAESAPSSEEAKEKAPEKAAAAPEKALEPQRDEQLEAKLLAMDPDKAAKVRAALARKDGNTITADAAEVESASEAALDAELEAKLAIMAPEKAAKVREALLDKAARDAARKGGE